jgi:DNA invertase Pin-like site-specific DNA recombinase
MQSTVYGYMRVRIGASHQDQRSLQHRLHAYAEANGLNLIKIFVEAEPLATSAFADLIETVKRQQAGTVLVPAVTHFGHLPGVQTALRHLLESQTGAVVIVMDDPPSVSSRRSSGTASGAGTRPC